MGYNMIMTKYKTTIKCDNCDKEFLKYNNYIKKTNFCSVSCKYAFKNSDTKTECKTCGKEIIRSKSYIRKNSFCNVECKSKWHSKQMKGENNPVYVERPVIKCSFCSKHFTKDYVTQIKDKNYFCDRLCEGKWNSVNRVGENSPGWRGGTTPLTALIRNSKRMQDWRKSVFKRDNWTCQDCGIRGSYLEAHHIKSFKDFPELRFELENGLTLCKECHKVTDNYGIKPYNLSRINNLMEMTI